MCIYDISQGIIRKMRNISYHICSENQNTHFMFNNFFSENHAIYEIIWKNLVEAGRPQMEYNTTLCMLDN